MSPSANAEPEGCSPRVFCFGVKLGKDPGDRFLECRQVARHCVPHDVEIDIEVAVAHPIAHVGDHVPRHFRMRGPNLIVYASCRFADNLYPVEHRALQQFAGVEARPVVLDVAPDPVDRGQDVRQTFTAVSQGDGLGQDPVPDARLQPTRRSHIHMTPDDLLNVKRETAEVEQRGVRTRGYQEIHVTRLDRFPASYRTEHTHITQAALGRGRENLPPDRPKGPEIRRPFHLRWTWHYESFPTHAARVLGHFTEPQVRPPAARHARLASWRQHPLSSPGYSWRATQAASPAFPPYASVPQTRSTATLCDQMRPDGSNIAPPTSVYDPVHGSPTTGIKPLVGRVGLEPTTGGL